MAHIQMSFTDQDQYNGPSLVFVTAGLLKAHHALSGKSSSCEARNKPKISNVISLHGRSFSHINQWTAVVVLFSASAPPTWLGIAFSMFGLPFVYCAGVPFATGGKSKALNRFPLM